MDNYKQYKLKKNTDKWLVGEIMDLLLLTKVGKTSLWSMWVYGGVTPVRSKDLEMHQIASQFEAFKRGEPGTREGAKEDNDWSDLI